MRRIILSSVACLAVPYFSTLLKRKRVLISSTILPETLLSLRSIQDGAVTSAYTFSSKASVILVRF
jgi:hypothetical protein